MVTSDAYKALSKVLGALRAHDTDAIEALADPRVRSGREDADDDLDQEHDGKAQWTSWWTGTGRGCG